MKSEAIKRAQFVAQLFAIESLKSAAPSLSYDGGISAAQADSAPSARLRNVKLPDGRNRMVFTLKAGTVDGFREVLIAAVAKALRAEADPEGEIKTGPAGKDLVAEATEHVNTRWTPDIADAFKFLCYEKAKSDLSKGTGNESIGIKVGDYEGLAFVSAAGADELKFQLESALTCEKCGHVNGQIVDAEPIKAKRKAERTAKGNETRKQKVA